MQKWIHEEPNRNGFFYSYSLLLIAGILVSGFARVTLAKTASGQQSSLLLTISKKMNALNYPAYPVELSERMLGNKKAPEGPKMDTALGQDWALVNIGFFEVFTQLVQPILPAVASCSSSTLVAIVDTGVDYTHPELRDNLWINSGETGAWEPPKDMMDKIACRDKSCNGIDDDGNGYIDDVVGWDFVHDLPMPYDTHGHGTHIAGIIAAASANGMGATGVCPKVTVMPLKYYDNSGIGYNNLNNTVRAIRYAIKAGAQIINYSGGGADPAPAEKAAIEEAQRKGILFVAAAGNDGHNNEQIPYYPASYGLDNIIGVASLNRQNQLLPSSNFGRSVQVAAPGLGIFSTLPESKFGTMSGTSQATAFVTGAAALLASQGKGAFDYRKVKHWIIEGTKPLKGNEKHQIVSGGMLNIAKALQIEREDHRRNATPVTTQELALSPRASKHTKAQ